MLLIDATLIRNVKKGTNLAEQHVARYETFATSQGNQQRPIMAYTHVSGGNFVGLAEIPAPIDLTAGDEIKVNQESGEVVFVIRNGETIWPKTETETDAELQIPTTSKRKGHRG